MNRKGCALLAAAIVRQAVKDWQEGDTMMKKECESFFRSEWYQELRDLSRGIVPENMERRL